MFPAENGRAGVIPRAGTYPLDGKRYQHFVVFAFILAGLFLLDILTTQFILWMGGVELNPVMALVVSNPVLHLAVKGAILLVIVSVAFVAEKYVRDSSVFFYCILITMYLFVITNNLFVILPRVLP
ncbi:DUF5658 family protein [Methanoregula sp.]|uniref:DUF5658 family protein n=1 Tax=Methanoregula sp. TaxID=2052170 RepID=UPI002372EC05|nr:DUF5658 family protein [Methanoregula sp.]MDD1687330.1 DUF5658 family protein [Methanoregula sp.]